MTISRWWKWTVCGAGLWLLGSACLWMVEGPALVSAQPAASSKGEDWPMFGGTVARNMANPNAKNVPTSWSVEEGKLENVKWVAELGSNAFGGPVISDGKVFIGTNNSHPRDKSVKGPKGVMMCFNEADGKFLWQTVHDMPADRVSEAAAPYGICSTPCVLGKRHYYQVPDANVVCADNDTGKVVWRHDMAKDKVLPWHTAASSPLIVDDLVMVVTGHTGVDEMGNPTSADAPSFIALNKDTGASVWEYKIPRAAIIEGQWSEPAVAVVDGKKQVIFPGGDCWLYSFEPKTGKQLWKFNCNPVRKTADGKPYTPYIVAAPVVYENRCYVALGCCPDSVVEERARIGYLLCVDVTRSGDVSPSSLNAKDPANKASALVWAYGGPIMPQPKRGRRDYLGRSMSTCAIHDGLVYAAEFAGFLHCLDARTGQHYWEEDLTAGVWGSPMYMDGKVYLGSEDASVAIYAHSKKLQKLAKVEMGDAVRGTPVFANGVLYVGTAEKLYAIAAKK